MKMKNKKVYYRHLAIIRKILKQDENPLTENDQKLIEHGTAQIKLAGVLSHA